MATNEILPFAQAGAANVLSQGAYSADAQRTAGNQPGIARAQLNNKALLQCSAIAAGLAKWIADRQASDITDQLSASVLAGYIQDALSTSLGSTLGGSNQSLGANLQPGYQKFPGSIMVQFGPAILPNSGARTSSISITYPIAFPNAYYVTLPYAVTSPTAGPRWPVLSCPVQSLSGATFQGDMVDYLFAGTSILGYIAIGA